MINLVDAFIDHAWLAGRVPRGGVVLDVGANIGQFRMFADTVLAPRRVVSFEPVRATWELLQRNFPAHALNLAVGDPAEIALYVDDQASARASSVREWQGARTEMAHSVRLDEVEEVRREPYIDLLKNRAAVDAGQPARDPACDADPRSADAPE